MAVWSFVQSWLYHLYLLGTRGNIPHLPKIRACAPLWWSGFPLTVLDFRFKEGVPRRRVWAFSHFVCPSAGRSHYSEWLRKDIDFGLLKGWHGLVRVIMLHRWASRWQIDQLGPRVGLYPVYSVRLSPLAFSLIFSGVLTTWPLRFILTTRWGGPLLIVDLWVGCYSRRTY